MQQCIYCKRSSGKCRLIMHEKTKLRVPGWVKRTPATSKTTGKFSIIWPGCYYEHATYIVRKWLDTLLGARDGYCHRILCSTRFINLLSTHNDTFIHSFTEHTFESVLYKKIVLAFAKNCYKSTFKSTSWKLDTVTHFYFLKCLTIPFTIKMSLSFNEFIIFVVFRN